ncbi:TlpA disulfide reductase family protein [uncultured Prevotella sp.]|uniref:thioredoxin-like domain-containing protein n=1 Tax=uncultured Prevotella sp. TaxID=159272 RepID=UPI00262C09AE|nr:TlpA disulfide reductase family protein [uncultured Prevotella sp.]
MKLLFNSLSLALAATFVAVGAFAQNFTVKGTIPGIKNGTKVSLRCQENGKSISAECLSKGDTFILTGNVSGTLLVQLQIDDKPQSEYRQDEYPQDRGGNFMLEAADYTVSAACFDSIPLNYSLTSGPMLHAKNLKIAGSKAQQQYQEWADATYDVRLNTNLLRRQLRNAQFRSRKEGGPDTAEVNRLQPILEAAQMAESKASAAFIAAHPDYAVSLLQQGDELEKPFAFTLAEYDRMLQTFAGNYDKLRYDAFVKTVADMKAYLKGSRYKDLSLETPDGTAVNLKDIVKPGMYNFIDFWASWCGPCRAAIPSVKQLYQKMNAKLNIVSISVDKRKADWTKAMEQERMPWRQLLVPEASMKALTAAYYIKYIPSLVVIDPEGNIQLYTSDPHKAHQYLEEHVK